MERVDCEKAYKDSVAVSTQRDVFRQYELWRGIFKGVLKNGNAVRCTHNLFVYLDEELLKSKVLYKKVARSVSRSLKNEIIDKWSRAKIESKFYWDQDGEEYHFIKIEKYEQIH